MYTEYPENGRSDVLLDVMPLSVDKPGDALHRYSGFTSAMWQCHPASRGRLAIRSPDPFEAPIIEPHYLSEQIDRDVAVAGVKMLCAIYRQPAFRELWAEEVRPGEDALHKAICEKASEGGKSGHADDLSRHHRSAGIAAAVRHLPPGKLA